MFNNHVYVPMLNLLRISKPLNILFNVYIYTYPFSSMTTKMYVNHNIAQVCMWYLTYLCIYSSENVEFYVLDSVLPYKVMAWLERSSFFHLHDLSRCEHFVFWDLFLVWCLRFDRANLVVRIFTVHIIWFPQKITG
jgi:hypothetical protein